MQNKEEVDSLMKRAESAGVLMETSGILSLAIMTSHDVNNSTSTLRNNAYYMHTTIPVSYLLSYLAVFSKFNLLKDAEHIKVCDFTCGGGTLLTASYSALQDLHTLEKFELQGNMNLKAFHKNMLENNFWAFDA